MSHHKIYNLLLISFLFLNTPAAQGSLFKLIENFESLTLKSKKQVHPTKNINRRKFHPLTKNIKRNHGNNLLSSFIKYPRSTGFRSYHPTPPLMQDQEQKTPPEGVTLLKPGETGHFIKPSEDWAFKMLFSKEHKNFVIRMISEIMWDNPDDPIIDLHFLGSAQEEKFGEENETSVDVVCITRGLPVLLKIQNRKNLDALDPAVFPSARFWNNQLLPFFKKENLNYSFIRYGLPFFVMSFTHNETFDYEGGDEKHPYIITDKVKEREIRGGAPIIFPRFWVETFYWHQVDIQQFLKNKTPPHSALDEFLYFMTHGDKIKTYSPETKIKEAYEALDQSKWSKEKREYYKSLSRKEKSLKKGDTLKREMLFAYDEGFLKGSKDEMAIRDEEIIVNMLQERFGLESISKVTGLSKDSIKALIEKRKQDYQKEKLFK